MRKENDKQPGLTTEEERGSQQRGAGRGLLWGGQPPQGPPPRTNAFPAPQRIRSPGLSEVRNPHFSVKSFHQ